MQKWTSIFLSLLMILSLVLFGCTPKGNNPIDEEITDEEITIDLSETEIEINVGQKITVSAQCSDKNAVLTWKSSNGQIADVYGGVIVGCKKGSTTVVCSDSKGRASASVVVNVHQQVGGVFLDKTVSDCAVNGNVKLTATVSPTYADNKNIFWSSSDTGIATVNEEGMVYGVSVGRVIITVTTEDGNKQDSIELQIVDSLKTDICNSIIKNYLAADRVESYRILQEYVTSASYRTVGYDYQALNISWNADGSASYTVYIADNSQYNNAYIETTKETVLNSGVCVPGETYFVKVSGDNGIIKEDKIEIADVPVRIVNVDGVSNVRDVGGFRTKSGKYVRYGKIYRGAEFETLDYNKSHSRITEKGKNTLINNLGIKTEIDLRFANQIPENKNSVGVENYFWKPLYNYSWIIPENAQDQFYNGATYQGATVAGYLRDIFGYFADESKYPLYFHCQQGADRTGTLAFLLNGLLGVEYEDLVRDYELTTFTWQGIRTGIVDKNDLTKPTDPSLYTKEQAKAASALYGMYWQLMAYYGDGSNDLSIAISNYLQRVCGVSQNTINTIKSIMLYDK